MKDNANEKADNGETLGGEFKDGDASSVMDIHAGTAAMSSVSNHSKAGEKRQEGHCSWGFSKIRMLSLLAQLPA